MSLYVNKAKRERYLWHQLPLQLAAQTGDGLSHWHRQLLEAREVLAEYDEETCPNLHAAYSRQCQRIADRIIQPGCEPEV